MTLLTTNSTPNPKATQHTRNTSNIAASVDKYGVVGWEVVEVKLREEEGAVTKLELKGRQVWWRGV